MFLTTVYLDIHFGLDYSGSQPFNCSVSYTNSTDTSVTGSQVGDNR